MQGVQSGRGGGGGETGLGHTTTVSSNHLIVSVQVEFYNHSLGLHSEVSRLDYPARPSSWKTLMVKIVIYIFRHDKHREAFPNMCGIYTKKYLNH